MHLGQLNNLYSYLGLKVKSILILDKREPTPALFIDNYNITIINSYEKQYSIIIERSRNYYYYNYLTTTINVSYEIHNKSYISSNNREISRN